MKRIIVFIIALAISLSVNAQDYQKLWNEYNESVVDFLPETAGKVLDKIEKQAIKDKNDVQLLKAVVKRCEVIGMKEENQKDTIIGYCRAFLPRLSKASQVIMNVEISRYIYDFEDLSAYQDDDYIKTVSMEQYADIFDTDSERAVFDIELEPTLYDYVMHCMIKHYRYYDNKKSLYEKLLAFDLQNNYIKAYYNNRIEQLGNIYDEKDFEKYSQLAEECTDNEYVAKIKIKQIEFLTWSNVGRFHIEQPYVKAKKLCDEAMALLDKNHPLYKQCEEYITSLTKKSIDIRMSAVCVPNQSIPVGLTYRNTTNPTYKIFKVSSNEFRLFQRLDDEKLSSMLLPRTAILQNTVETTVETDYDEHSSLIALPALKSGLYYLVFSNSDSFENYKDLIFAPVQVSELSYFTLKTDDNLNVYIVNRETGAPMPNVKARFVRKNYNYKTKLYDFTTIGEAVSDKDGFLVTPMSNETAFYIDLYGKNDTILACNTENNSNYTTKDKIVIRTNIYTDRGIYRPGQTVYFSGLILRKTAKSSEILPDYEEVVSLYDPNHKIVDTLRVRSDEWGAFSGSFTLPTDRLRGIYQIKHDYDGTSFKVEEYKRPTFEVTFSGPENTFRVGDSVTVTGKVAALSGFGLDNAKFRYVVIRKTFFPYRFIDWSPRHVEDEMISEGESITLSDGTFNIDFQLLPDRDIRQNHIPYYTYEIKIEATSKQGETQVGTYKINATYNKYDIKLEHNDTEIDDIETVEIKDLKDYYVTVKNIAGNAANTKLECKIFKFNDLDRYERDLGTFDRQILSDKMLKAYFPKFDFYSTQKITKDIVYQSVIDVNGKALLISGSNILKPGKYLIELKSVDDSLSVYYDQCVVFDVKSKKMPYKSMYWTSIDKKQALPGEAINYYVGSSENVQAMIIVKLSKKIIKTERITLNNSIYRFTYKVREEDRGQLDFQVALEKYNTEMRHIDYVDVPFNNMDLDVTLNTKRTVLAPGEDVTWSVTVKDYKNNPVEAAMMAVMYDASLDNFASHSWDLRTKPVLFSSSTIMSDRSFSTLIKYQPFDIARFYYDTNMMFSSATLLPDMYRYINKHQYEERLYYSMDSKRIAANGMNEELQSEEEKEAVQNPAPKMRKDFRETAFFYPHLKTDENGECKFSFTTPDALTRWNLKLLTYSKTLSVGKLEKSILTQQTLMIMADMPRFVYDQDTVWIAANVINMTPEEQYATAQLEIFDENNNRMNLLLSPSSINIDEEIPAHGSHAVRWKVAMKKGLGPLTFRFTALTEGLIDCEEHILPVLSSDIFMTQTYALTVEAQSKKQYEINVDNLGERNHDVRLNINANPLYYALLAMPYLAEGNENHTTTVFNRAFVNTMARQIMESNPEIKEIIERYGHDTLSELDKNEDLKAVLLQATPWIFEAQSEEEQRANIIKLFDKEEIDKNINSALSSLAQKQKDNGGWPWIEGLPESEYITQYILYGLGRLNLNPGTTAKAYQFLGNQIVDRYKRLDTQKKKKAAVYDYTTMLDLFAMSYYPQYAKDEFKEACTFYINKLQSNWRRFDITSQAYIALTLYRNGADETAMLIVKSLRERAIKNGHEMYWRNISIDNEARILEAFDEIDPKTNEIDAMRLWILSQKRTNMWENDRATVEAIFSLMNRGTKWEDAEINSKFVQENGNVHVLIKNPTNHVVWGGVFRQYFVPIDNIKKHNDAMKIKREIVANDNVKVGDKVKIVITFENSQDMEFVYLKDLRGACFEPVKQLSRYTHDDGLWYYQSTTDAAVEYFFERLPKGKHTVSYEAYVTKDGGFSAGYSQIQCQYAPEFGAYSNGSRISVNP